MHVDSHTRCPVGRALCLGAPGLVVDVVAGGAGAGAGVAHTGEVLVLVAADLAADAAGDPAALADTVLYSRIPVRVLGALALARCIVEHTAPRAGDIGAGSSVRQQGVFVKGGRTRQGWVRSC